MIKVSVIVPVYNPGNDIDDCIASLLNQSLPAGEYEAIFVDDGSTDGTPARLDALAAEHDHVRVEHIPNSGWPGKPRNVGLEMARGEYVYFVDNDDWIEREALARMYEMAVADDAEVVIGKVVGHGKFVPRSLFKETLHGVQLSDSAPLLGLLSPHKLFRASLLAEHGIRFPEGRRRLEDHVFVMHAYFHAQRVSVLADYPCYHWVLRDEDTNASYRPFDPQSYFANVREVLDLVEEHTAPGPLRDRLMRHWYRGKMLGRIGGTPFVRREPDYNREIHAEVRKLALERYGADAAAKLPFNLRVRSHLLREGSFEALYALAEREGELRTKSRLVDVRGDGTWLRLDVETQLRGREHGPLTFTRSGERLAWNAPAAVGELPPDLSDVADEIGKARATVLLRADGVEYQLPGRTEVRLDPVSGAPAGTVRPVLTVQAHLAPTLAAAGSPLPAGEWEVHVLVNLAGFADARALKHHKKTLVLVATPPGRVELREDFRLHRPPARTLARRVAGRLPRVARAVRRLRARRGAPERR
jgi:glycosyltransferase involved in cell wall biosynthesis